VTMLIGGVVLYTRSLPKGEEGNPGFLICHSFFLGRGEYPNMLKCLPPLFSGDGVVFFSCVMFVCATIFFHANISIFCPFHNS